jgi:hypothetical protein
MGAAGWMPQAWWPLLTHQPHSEWIFTAPEGSASFDLHQIAGGPFS